MLERKPWKHEYGQIDERAKRLEGLKSMVTIVKRVLPQPAASGQLGQCSRQLLLQADAFSYHPGEYHLNALGS